MKKQTVYDRLQMQYQKLNQRIQKAMTTGRFYKYTQFKQQQLLNRLQRCSFQLKQLGAGVAVMAALGMASPVAGQVSNLVERTGTANPFDGIPHNNTYRPTFVDIDGDGDLDMFRGLVVLVGSPGYMEYYENTGTANAANFSLVQGAGNPFFGFQGTQHGLTYPSFVDIDNDGDMDLFGGDEMTDTATIKYYENIGTVTAPVFVDAGSANPLDTLVSAIHVNGIDNQYQPFFVDIDHDGDQDCLISHSTSDYSTYSYTATIHYYENIGTASAASFEERTGAANPFDFMSTVLASVQTADPILLQFADMDQDGNQDVFVTGRFHANDFFEYYENTGTATVPAFSHNAITPLDSITVIVPRDLYQLALVDIDGDGDQDVLHHSQTNSSVIKFYENLDITVGIDRIEQASFSISPNPTSGTLSFEKAISGRLTVYTLDGKELWARALKEEQEVDLEAVGEGLFFVRIATNKEQIVKKILIKK